MAVIERSQPGPYAWLLGSLLLLMIGMPVLQLTFGRLPIIGMQSLSSIVVISGVYAVSRRRSFLWVGLVLAVPSLASEVIAYDSGSKVAIAINILSSALFLSFTATAVLYSILGERRVTEDTILGGISVYLLMGLVFAFIYGLVELLAPGSFEMSTGEPALELDVAQGIYLEPHLIYYSFVTLTTLGYGDIWPAGGAAQLIAAGEAVVGQLYLVIFIARLVGLHIASRGGGWDD